MNFPSVILKIAFTNNQWGRLTHCGCDQRVSFLNAWSKLKPLLAVPSDRIPSENIDNEKGPWWDLSTMSKLHKVWHAGNAGARTGVSTGCSLHLMTLISSSKFYLLWKSVHRDEKHWSFVSLKTTQFLYCILLGAALGVENETHKQ